MLNTTTDEHLKLQRMQLHSSEANRLAKAKPAKLSEASRSPDPKPLGLTLGPRALAPCQFHGCAPADQSPAQELRLV